MGTEGDGVRRRKKTRRGRRMRGERVREGDGVRRRRRQGEGENERRESEGGRWSEKKKEARRGRRMRGERVREVKVRYVVVLSISQQLYNTLSCH